MNDKIKSDVTILINDILELIYEEQSIVEDEVRPAIYTPYNRDKEPEKVLVHVSRRPKYNGSFVCEKEDGTMKEMSAYSLKFIDNEKNFKKYFEKYKTLFLDDEHDESLG